MDILYIKKIYCEIKFIPVMQQFILNSEFKMCFLINIF